MDKKSQGRFLIVWFVNSLVIYLAALTFPTKIVLGTYRQSVLVAALLTGLLLTLFLRVAKSLIRQPSLKVSGRYKMFVYYWFVNFLSLWILSRFPQISGFGIARYYWALLLGFILSSIQWSLRQGMKAVKYSS